MEYFEGFFQMTGETSSEVHKRFQEIPDDRRYFLECRMSAGVLANNADPMLFIEAALHPLASPLSDEDEEQPSSVFAISLSDALVLRRTINRLIAQAKELGINTDE